MDQEHHKAQPGPSGPGATENSSSSADGLASETGVVVNSEERGTVCAGQYNRDREVLGCDLGSSKGLMSGHEKIFNQEMIDRGGGSEGPGRVDRGGSETSSNMVDGVVSGTAIFVNSVEALHASGDDRGLGAKVTDLGSSKVSTKDVKKRVSELEKDSVVIDVKCGSGKGFSDNRDGEKVCRICHLSSDQSSDVTTPVPGNANMTETTDLIQLGCCCKDELGIAHSYCAEAWFKLRGNRLCEICGKTAKNVTGVGDNRFMEEWNEGRFTSGSSNSADRRGGCWRGQPFCNFLMACLVIAFVLPWFFRVNMF